MSSLYDSGQVTKEKLRDHIRSMTIMNGGDEEDTMHDEVFASILNKVPDTDSIPLDTFIETFL